MTVAGEKQKGVSLSLGSSDTQMCHAGDEFADSGGARAADRFSTLILSSGEIAAAGQRLQAFITGDTGPACEPLRINGLSHGYFSGSRSSMDEVIFRNKRKMC